MYIALAPKKKLTIDSWWFNDGWTEFGNRLIWISYLDLVINNYILIKYEVKHKRVFWGFFRWKTRLFYPEVNRKQQNMDHLGWLEKQIISSVNMDKDMAKKTIFKEQIAALIDHLIGNKTTYAHPWKCILEKVIVNVDHSYWEFKYQKGFLNLTKDLEFTLKDSFENSSIRKLDDFERLINLLSLDVDFRKFSDNLFKCLDAEINKRQDTVD